MTQFVVLRSVVIVAGVLAIASACVSSGSPGAAPAGTAAIEASPCTVPVSEAAETPWREVRATGFTFCVPADWQPVGRPQSNSVDAETWRGDGGSISWGTGERRPLETGTAVVVVRAGAPPPSRATSSAQFRRFSEVIGGRTAQLWDNLLDRNHHTGAEWVRPAVYIEGVATKATTARLQLAVYRTVRFTEP